MLRICVWMLLPAGALAGEPPVPAIDPAMFDALLEGADELDLEALLGSGLDLSALLGEGVDLGALLGGDADLSALLSGKLDGALRGPSPQDKRESPPRPVGPATVVQSFGPAEMVGLPLHTGGALGVLLPGVHVEPLGSAVAAGAPPDGQAAWAAAARACVVQTIPPGTRVALRLQAEPPASRVLEVDASAASPTQPVARWRVSTVVEQPLGVAEPLVRCLAEIPTRDQAADGAPVEAPELSWWISAAPEVQGEALSSGIRVHR